MAFEENFDGGQLNPIGADPVLVVGVQLQAEGEQAHVSLNLINNLAIASYRGIPNIKLKGNVIPMEQVRAKPNFALGNAIETAAGAAI